MGSLKNGEKVYRTGSKLGLLAIHLGYIVIILYCWNAGLLGVIADTETYVTVAERISKLGWQDDVESLFNIQVLGLEELGYGAEATVELMRLFNVLIVAVCMLIFFPINNGNSLGLVTIVSLYGPLLSLVLLRASPAYIFIFIAIHYLMQNKSIKGLLSLSVSVLFHITSLIAIIPLLLSKLLSKNKIDVLQSQMLSFFLLPMIAIVFFFGIFGINLYDYFFQMFDIGKYIVYFEIGDESSGLMHKIYFLAVIIISVMFYINRNEYSSLERNYILLSLMAYLVFSSTPVLAFRQSIFWIPVILFRIGDWRYFSSPLVRLVVISISAPIFIYSLFSISG